MDIDIDTDKCDEDVNTYGNIPLILLVKIKKKILINIIDILLFLECIVISFIIVLVNLIIQIIIFLWEFQYGIGNKKIINILIQFSDNIPVVGSNVENKLVIILIINFFY